MNGVVLRVDCKCLSARRHNSNLRPPYDRFYFEQGSATIYIFQAMAGHWF